MTWNIHMKHFAQAAGLIRIYAGVVAVGILMGCSSTPVQGDSSWRLVPLADVKQVVGEWDGNLRKEGNVLPVSIQLRIRENGAYLFTGQHAGTVAVGSGFLESRDGRLRGDTDRRTIMFALYDHNGNAILWVDATNQAGERYHGQFTKVK
jgi:hypothetical protein